MWIQVPAPLLLAVMQSPTRWLLGVVLGVLAVLSLLGRFLRERPEGTVNPALVRKFNQRMRAWWLMTAILVAAMLLGRNGAMVLFFCLSFWALREFITMTPTRRGDHRALFWVFFLCTPLQYVLVAMGQEWYGVYSIMIPVYASLFVPARITISGDPKRFLERSAKIQFGLLICVYALSYAPALLTLELKVNNAPWTGDYSGLLFYFFLIVQLGDLLQFAWDKLVGKTVIAPAINASRTWEGFIGGVLSMAILGITLKWVTPFGYVEAAVLSATVAVMGFCGAMTMSAIKRDRGVTDYGTLVQGHAGLLDRIDSLCFAAPVFYHMVRFLYHG